MTKADDNLEAFVEGIRRARDDTEKSLADYRARQGKEEIHKLRSSIRRLEVSYRLLPKTLRKDHDEREYMAEMKKLFRLNSGVRDLDIMQDMLKLHFSSKPDLKWLAARLDKERASNLQSAERFVSSLDVEAPKITAGSISPSWLRRRFRKVAKNLLDDIEEELDGVRKDQRNIRLLHSLRKNSKMLRYAIELLPADDGKLQAVLKRLEEWQNSLGSIRDIDMLLAYLEKGNARQNMGLFVDEKKRERSRLYLGFIKLSKSPNLGKQVRSLDVF